MNETAHILVVDDDQSVRRVFQQILTTSGYRISTANSGEEALAYLDLITPDLILMDLNLPGITGIETITRIKADTTKPFISVMLVTARGDQAAKVQGLDAGADDFLVKPVDLTELLARVRALLRLQSSHRSLYAEQRKTELLLHLTRALSTTLDFDQLLTHFLNRLSDSIGAIRASIILIIDEQPRLYSSTGRMPQTPLPHILREGVAGWVLRNRHPIIIEDTRQDTRWIAQNPHQQVVRSIAATPIIRDERTFGVITLMHHTPGYFNDEHIDLLNTVATQCAFALENAELFELTRQQKDLLERRAEELERINQVSQYLSELMSPEQLLRQVVEVVHTSFGYPRVAMLLREGNELVIRAAAGDRVALGRLGERQPADAGYSGWAAAHQEPLCIIHIPQDSHEPLVGDTDARSIVAIPIRSSRGAFGVLEVTSPVVDAFGQDDLRLLGTLAGQLGVALQNAQLYDDEQNRVRQLERVNSLSISMTAQFGQATDLAIAAEAINTIFRVETSALVVRGTPPRAAFHSRSAVVQRLTLPTSALTAINLTGLETVVDVHNGQQLEGALDWLERAGITSLALVPLLAGRDQIGLILIDITGHTEQVARGELTLLETIASLIAQAIQNSRLYTQVESERSTVNAVLEGAADSILLIDQQEQLRLANRAAIERFGLTDPIGKTILDLNLPGDLPSALSDSIAIAGATHEIMLPDGSTVSVSVAPVRAGDNAPLGRVAVIQDITAIRELERREQEWLRSVFRRYVSPQVVEEVLAGAGTFGEPAERQIVVLFADIRGYTRLTEGMPPRVLVEQVLNRYFNAMTEALYRHDGTVDKFLGDGIIGLFGVPIARPDDVLRSLKAAVAMQRAFAELQRHWQQDLDRDIGMGIGMSYGRAIVGNIGSSQRLDYTVIGDVVNTASRLNGLASAGQIVISHHLVEALSSDAVLPGQLQERGRVMLKGKREPHLVYEIVYNAQTVDQPASVSSPTA